MHNCVTSHLCLKTALARVIPSMHVHLCVALWLISLHPSPVFYFVPPLFFQPFQMSSSEFHERFRSNPLCDFRLGTVATSDHETPLTPLELDQETLRDHGGVATSSQKS